MTKDIVLKQTKLGRLRKRIKAKEDLIDFVAFQFDQLRKKHLSLPIQLYHL